MRTRYTKIALDQESEQFLSVLEIRFTHLEGLLDATLTNSRAKSMIVTHLEEAYMWVEKAIINDQDARNAAAKLEASRGAGGAVPRSKNRDGDGNG